MPAGLATYATRNSAQSQKWILGRHLAYLNRKLLDVAAGRTTRLMVWMPPRHGKSEFISKYFTAWFEGTEPDAPIILTSYEADFAASWGGKTRDILEEHGPEVFGVSIRQDSKAKDEWRIKDHNGGMNTAGAGGAITGKGCKVLIIDDPFKNSESAKSKTNREKIKEWYRSTAYTRLEPGGAIIIIMTRWHEDDLCGWLIKEQEEAEKEGKEDYDKWEVVNFPAIAEEEDILGRKPGEALFPERFDEKALLKIKETLGTYWWSALYQQRPQPDGGTIFKRSYFRYFKEEWIGNDRYFVLSRPEGEKKVEASKCMTFQTIDPAATEKEKSDYFVCSTWILTPERDLLLYDRFREKAETVKHMGILRSQYDRYRPAFQGVENKTFGLNIIQDARGKGLPVKPLPADTDKVSRARPIEARYELGTVYHRQNAPWLAEFEDELIDFPNGAHDDQVDTASYAGIFVATGGSFRVIDTVRR